MACAPDPTKRPTKIPQKPHIKDPKVIYVSKRHRNVRKVNWTLVCPEMNQFNPKKNDVNMEKALITGIFHMGKAFLTELNYVESTSVDQNFDEGFYGFSAKEVKILAQNCGIDNKNLEKIKTWYNGYLFEQGETYNPWSIVNCISKLSENQGEASFQNFWDKTRNFENCINFLRIVDVQFQIKQLINNKEIPFPNVHLCTEIYQELVDFASNKSIAFLSSPVAVKYLQKVFFQILFDSGYFTLTANGKMKIPNKEIKEELILRMRSFFETKYNINFEPSANSLAEIFNSKNQENKKCQEVLKNFCNNFNDVLKICPPFFDIQSEKTEYGIHPNEDLVHSLLNVICYQIN